MSPRSSFDHWSAVSLTGNDMTSSSGHVIALDQSEARKSTKRAHSTTPVSLPPPTLTSANSKAGSTNNVKLENKPDRNERQLNFLVFLKYKATPRNRDTPTKRKEPCVKALR